jgi:hypothetical protein
MAQLLNLIAYIIGAIGTALLFFFSYTAFPSGAGVGYVGRETHKHFEAVEKKNKRWTLFQRIGFALLTLSFLLQIVAVFVPPSWGS